MEISLVLSPTLSGALALTALDKYLEPGLGRSATGRRAERANALSLLRSVASNRTNPMSALEVISRINSGLPGKSVRVIQELLDIRNKEMADILSREDKTIRQWSRRPTLSSTASEQVFRLLKVYFAACSVMEDEEEALAWFKEPSEPLGGQTPMELLRTSEGEALVMDELMQMEYGHPV